MAYCPVCKKEWPEGTSDCPICHRELDEGDESPEWVMLGTIEDKLSADFARETLASYEIPAVVISRSGFFGTIGLPLRNFYSGELGLWELSVPSEFADEAQGIVTMILGAKWRPRVV